MIIQSVKVFLLYKCKKNNVASYRFLPGEGLQAAILTAIEVRFPALTKQAQTRVTQITDVTQLLHLIEQLMIISDEESARTLLTL